MTEIDSKMEPHRALSDAEFEQQFKSCAMDPTVFSHEAHIRLAWLAINKYGLNKATSHVQTLLERFVAHHQAQDKYHKTLTVAAVQVVYHFMANTKADDFADFISASSPLITNFKSLIGAHYSFDIFQSEGARLAYIEPDLAPFD